MKEVLLKPNQIIGMIDYPPLHSLEALKNYYEDCKAHRAINPVPVIPLEKVIAYCKRKKRFETYKESWEIFLEQNPEVKYFMYDGKHRSTAMMLAQGKIDCVELRNDNDAQNFFKLSQEGKITTLGVKPVLNEMISELEVHFLKHQKFWSVEEKTKAMIAQGDIPLYMLT